MQDGKEDTFVGLLSRLPSPSFLSTPSSSFSPILARRIPEIAIAKKLYNMRLFRSALLVAALGWISTTAAHNIQLKAHSRECFHETLHRDDKMTVSFQVGDREFGGSGNLDLDFWVRRVYSPIAVRDDSGENKRWAGHQGMIEC